MVGACFANKRLSCQPNSVVIRGIAPKPLSSLLDISPERNPDFRLMFLAGQSGELARWKIYLLSSSLKTTTRFRASLKKRLAMAVLNRPLPLRAKRR